MLNYVELGLAGLKTTYLINKIISTQIINLKNNFRVFIYVKIFLQRRQKQKQVV